MQYFTPLQTIFSAQATTGTGTVINVEDWEKILVEFGTASNANLTCLLQGSISETAPDFSAARSTSNHWDYLSFRDADTVASELPDATAGATGFAVSGTDNFMIVNVVSPGIKWLCATVTARSAGSITVKARGVKTKHV